MLSNGKKVVLVCFLIMYFIPMILGTIYYDEVIKYYPVYRIEPFSIRFFISLFGTLLCFFIFSKIKFPAILSNIKELQTLIGFLSKKYNRMRNYFILFSLSIGVCSLVTHASSFRYASSSLTESHTYGLIILNMVCYLILSLDLFSVLFSVNYNSGGTKRRTDVLAAISYLTLSNGIITLFIALIMLVLISYPKFRLVLYKTDKLSFKLIIRFLVFGFIMLLIVNFALRYGSIIKNASLGERQRLSVSIPTVKLIGTSIGRVSSYYDTLLYTSSNAFGDNIAKKDFAILVPFKTMYYRMSRLFPWLIAPEIKADYPSFSRSNYLNLSTTRSNLREGSSPGVISAFDYLFMFPFSIVICSLYLCFISNVIDRIMQNNSTKLSWFGAFFVFQLTCVFFESPFDLLNLLDNGTLLALGFYCMSIKSRPMLYRKKEFISVK
jgi:hypothetical protein